MNKTRVALNSMLCLAALAHSPAVYAEGLSFDAAFSQSQISSEKTVGSPLISDVKMSKNGMSVLFTNGLHLKQGLGKIYVIFPGGKSTTIPHVDMYANPSEILLVGGMMDVRQTIYREVREGYKFPIVTSLNKLSGDTEPLSVSPMGAYLRPLDDTPTPIKLYDEKTGTYCDSKNNTWTPIIPANWILQSEDELSTNKSLNEFIIRQSILLENSR